MTVINVIELTKTAPGIIISTIASAVLLCLFIFGCIKAKHDMFGGFCSIMALVNAVFFIVLILGGDEITVPNGEYRYEVLISDDVAFHEVIDKYDIIEQRGDIFVLEEKE